MAVNFAGLDHVALYTKDMDATVRFYNNVLGVKLVRAARMVSNNQRIYAFDMGKGTYLHFFDGPDSPGEVGHQIMGHMAINVDTEKEFDETYARLKENEIEVTDVSVRDRGKTFFFSDPNGVRIQLELQTGPTILELDGDPEAVPAVRELLALIQS